MLSECFTQKTAGNSLIFRKIAHSFKICNVKHFCATGGEAVVGHKMFQQLGVGYRWNIVKCCRVAGQNDVMLSLEPENVLNKPIGWNSNYKLQLSFTNMLLHRSLSD